MPEWFQLAQDKLALFDAEFDLFICVVLGIEAAAQVGDFLFAGDRGPVLKVDVSSLFAVEKFAFAFVES